MNAPIPRASTLDFYKEGMRRVLRRIQEDLDSALTLESLSRLASLSPFHFHRVFRGMVGEPLAAHVRRLRLERAAYALKTTEERVIEIALAAGYDSHEAFTRAFKSAYGHSPSHYRRGVGLPMAIPAPSRVHYHPSRTLRDFRTFNRKTPMTICIENLEPMRVAFVHHRGPYDQCGRAWDQLCTWMGKEGYLGGGCRFVGISYDDPEVTPPEAVRYDACVTVDESFEATAEIGVKVIGGGVYARTTHHGPYENFNDTYARIMGQWAPRQGYRLRDEPCLEFYLNSPEDTPSEDLLTDVFVPVERQ